MIRATTAFTRSRHVRPDTAETFDAARDIDWIAVERAADGDYDPRLLNRGEQQALVVILARAGISERQMAASMGVPERYISRWKQRARAAARRGEQVAEGVAA